MTLTHTEMLLRMAVAVAVGGLIGFERGRRDHPAGLRTHMLVALAAATFQLVSTQFLYTEHGLKNDLVRVDTSRIAASVVAGMGFLGAGAILRSGPSIHGLTTAASLWLVTAVGMAAGGGLYTEAIAATGISLFVLFALHEVETRFWKRVERQVEIDLDGGAGRPDIVEALRTCGVEVADLGLDRDLRRDRSRLSLALRLADETAIGPAVDRLESLPGVRRVRVSTREQGLGWPPGRD
jgi:putative Mg2+ transporter-C (MgtC) family protein